MGSVKKIVANGPRGRTRRIRRVQVDGKGPVFKKAVVDMQRGACIRVKSESNALEGGIRHANNVGWTVRRQIELASRESAVLKSKMRKTAPIGEMPRASRRHVQFRKPQENFGIVSQPN